MATASPIVRPGQCRCGYNLRDCAPGPCPECGEGWWLDPSEHGLQVLQGVRPRCSRCRIGLTGEKGDVCPACGATINRVNVYFEDHHLPDTSPVSRVMFVVVLAIMLIAAAWMAVVGIMAVISLFTHRTAPTP